MLAPPRANVWMDAIETDDACQQADRSELVNVSVQVTEWYHIWLGSRQIAMWEVLGFSLLQGTHVAEDIFFAEADR